MGARVTLAFLNDVAEAICEPEGSAAMTQSAG